MSRSAAHSYQNRLGFHYFPDGDHYRQKDADIWIPVISDLDAAWLVMRAPIQRAIPEEFIKRAMEAGIEPILHFSMNGDAAFDQYDFRLLMDVYARWGVNYVMLFEQPNSRLSWSTSAWVQMDLVERFLDGYLPFAEIILEEKMKPVFPPLTPGGDFWDLSFLRLSLQSILRRGKEALLESLVLGAYGDIFSKPLDWGAGGPEQWVGARPYPNTPNPHDHRGFRVFDWYSWICEQELGESLPIMMFGLGGFENGQTKLQNETYLDGGYHYRILTLLEALSAGGNDEILGQPFPPELVACNFEVLVPYLSKPGKDNGELIFARERELNREIFHKWMAIRHGTAWNLKTHQPPKVEEVQTKQDPEATPEIVRDYPGTEERRFSHYVLLPLYAWGAADWDLEMVQPLIQQSHPTVGYSLEEALHAERVTVVGGPGAISEEALEMLRKSGCQVERMLPDGTVVAT